MGEAKGDDGLDYLDSNLLVYRLLLVLDLLLQLLQLGAIGCGAVCLQHLDVSAIASASMPGKQHRPSLLISERCDLLLLDLIVGKVLLVLLPGLACG